VASVYTPKDYSFDRIMEDLVALAERQRAATGEWGAALGLPYQASN
jgi:hypothetical protein